MYALLSRGKPHDMCAYSGDSKNPARMPRLGFLFLFGIAHNQNRNG
jgi:hypothetical protein